MDDHSMQRETRDLSLAHVGRYGAMGPQDCVKLLYQATFGPGHLLKDAAGALEYLKKEWAQTPAVAGPPFEGLGEVGRLHLGRAKALGARPETVFALFRRAARPMGDSESFSARLAVLSDLANRGALPFSGRETAEYLAAYEAQGRPAVHHTQNYRTAYAPAYRLVEREGGRFFPLFCAIDRQVAALGRAVVAVDGMACAGKTTLAALLADVYACPVVHMDDFFLQPAQRTPARLAEVGGNFDRERFLQEVAAPLRAGQPFDYRVFDCGPMAFAGRAHIPAAPVTVVEGSYSLHPALRNAYTLGAFLTLTPQEQSRRILARNGPAMHRRFMEEWVPMENRYFAAAGVEAAADLVFSDDV